NLEVRPEIRPRDSVARGVSWKEATSTAVSVFDIRAARSAGADAADGVHGRRGSGRAFRPHLEGLAVDYCGIRRTWPGKIRLGLLMRSRFASKGRGPRLPSQ